jgi:hypothetical protein
LGIEGCRYSHDSFYCHLKKIINSTPGRYF